MIWRFLLLSILCCGAVLGSNERRLTYHLLQNYNAGGSKYGRPVQSDSEALEVRHGLALQAIVDVDKERQQLVINAWENLQWKDALLRWNPSEYGNVQSVRLPVHEIYIPDIVPYNQNSPAENMIDNMVVVYADGTVSYVPPRKFTTSCSMDKQPNADVQCSIKVGSWTFDGSKLNLTNIMGDVDTSTYQAHPEWDLVDTKVQRHVMQYECCPEPYIDITYSLHLSPK